MQIPPTGAYWEKRLEACEDTKTRESSLVRNPKAPAALRSMVMLATFPAARRRSAFKPISWWQVCERERRKEGDQKCKGDFQASKEHDEDDVRPEGGDQVDCGGIVSVLIF